MKKIFLIILLGATFISCKKETELQVPVFPGYSGKGEYATWALYKFNITNTTYLTAALPLQSPPTTLTAFDAALKAARDREVSPFSLRLYKDGGIATIVKNAQNQDVWQIQSNLKWEVQGDFMRIYRNVNNNWVDIIEATPDLDKMNCKFRRTYFGDNSADKDLFVMEAFYTIARLN
ncbi:MAG: hypothetical protein ACO25B_13240 [Chitinophagaceae bacterium]